ncbi:MAG: DNA polymerase IV [Candidatus Puniceispirillales bacterium]|nr:DNA polymerase IV [Alphaproteobacteria bacterium]
MSDHNANPVLPWLCRDCLDDGNSTTQPQCPSCGSWKMIRHPELRQLTLAHVDCDAFYAAIEKRDNPELLHKPVIVGGGKRGVVATACYIARIHGVRSAMPMYKALKLCPDAVVVRPRMEVYKAVGHEVRALMLSLTPLVEPLSIDEAFLDLSGTETLHQRFPAASMAHLANLIKTELGITVSIGLSGNKSLAKMASDMDKPKGFHIIGMAEAASLLAPLPVNVIYGTGKAMSQKFNIAGIKTCGDLAKAPLELVMTIAGSNAVRIKQLAAGIDQRQVVPDRPAKSISSETTFDTDLADLDALTAILESLSDKVASRLKSNNLAGRRVVLKLKSHQHQLLTRSQTLPDPTQLARKIFDIGVKMLKDEVAPHLFWRLIGIGVEQLVPSDQADPVNLAEPDLARVIALEDTVDRLRQRHGKTAIVSGRQFSRHSHKDSGDNDPDSKEDD